jgi:hypothetical protein
MSSRVDTTPVEVQTTATQLVAGDHRRSVLAIANTGPNAIYIGNEDVTTDTGFPIAATTGVFSADQHSVMETLYAIAATANQASPADTRVLEVFDS